MSNDVYQEWQAEAQKAATITVGELDSLIESYIAKRGIYEEHKAIASEKYKEYEDAENKVTAALTALGKKSYKLEGVGTFTRVMKEVVTVPKELEKKRSFFNWIKDKYGVDTLDTMLSINHQSVNSFYRQEADKHKDDLGFSIPGIEAPTSTETVSFRKDK